LTITDKDGGTSTDSLTVTVANVAPSVDAGTDLNSAPGQVLSFAGRFTDPGSLDTHTIRWNFGDGSAPVTGSLTPSYSYNTPGTYTATLTLTDNDGAVTTDTLQVVVAPYPTLTISDRTLTEGDTGSLQAIFTVSLSSPSLLPVTVTYSTANGTATAGSDYTAATGTLTFAAGETSKTITIQITGDTLVEPTETFFVNLTSANNATIADGQGQATLIDNDVVVLPSLSINDVSLTEGDTGTKALIFTVSLSTATTRPVTVAYSTANGTAIACSDYTTASGTLTFAAGETSKTITVQVIGDTLVEANETFFVNLTNASNATILDGQGQATIINNDTRRPASIRAQGTVRINGGGDFDGAALNSNDDAFIYAGSGYQINGQIELAVRRDANGNPIRDRQNKMILADGALTVGSGYTTAQVSGNISNQYAGVTTPQVIDPLVIDVPAYASTRQTEYDRRVPGGTSTATFNASTHPLNTTADWMNRFPTPGTATTPRVVRVTNGGLNIPANVILRDTVIIVENGDINLNGSGHTFTNVMLITNNGNINLGNVQSTGLAAFASGSVNMNGGARFSGDTLLANGSSSGSITFNGATTTTDASSNLRVIAQGNLTFNGATNTRGQFLTARNFTFNGSSTLIGSIDAKGDITFNGKATVVGV
jgi:large repetitive protein